MGFVRDNPLPLLSEFFISWLDRWSILSFHIKSLVAILYHYCWFITCIYKCQCLCFNYSVCCFVSLSKHPLKGFHYVLICALNTADAWGQCLPVARSILNIFWLYLASCCHHFYAVFNFLSMCSWVFSNHTWYFFSLFCLTIEYYFTFLVIVNILSYSQTAISTSIVCMHALHN